LEAIVLNIVSIKLWNAQNERFRMGIRRIPAQERGRGHPHGERKTPKRDYW
jgi:hypothetical protein